MFSLFGLLLGFSIAEVAGGFSRAYDARAERPIGWLGPGLAAILLLDILSFWFAGWQYREILPLNMGVLIAAAVVGLLYYFAATQVFPREASSLAPSDHVMVHRRPIAIAVIASNLILFGPAWVLFVIRYGWDTLLQPAMFLGLAYFALLTIAGFIPGRRRVAAALAAAFFVQVVGLFFGGE